MQDLLNTAPGLLGWLQTSLLARFDVVWVSLLFIAKPLFYFLVLPLLYWSFDARLAIRLMILACLAAFVANLLAASHAIAYDLPSGFGFFSASLVVAACLWLTVAGSLQRRLFLVPGMLVPLLLALAQVYSGQLVWLGALLSLLTGWLLGAVWLAAGTRFEPSLVRLHPRISISLAALAAFAMNALQMGHTGLPGLLLGTVVGSSLAFKKLAFSASRGSVPQRLLRLLPGFVGLQLLAWLAGRWLPAPAQPLYPLSFFVYSFGQGLWCTWASLILCQRLGLIPQQDSPA